MSRIATNIFAALAATGQTAAYELPADACSVDVFLQEGANDGGGTLKMQESFDGGTTWVDVPSASWTSGDGLLGSYVVLGRDIRFDLAGATTPSGMVVQIVANGKSQPMPEVNGSFTADGTSAVFSLPRVSATLRFYAKGTFGSGTVKLEFSADGGTTWYDAAAGLTAAGVSAITVPVSKVLFRVNLAGATTPSLNWFLRGV